MKKVLAFLVALGLLFGFGVGASVDAQTNYDDIPWEYVSVPVQ